jgi:hypothetical protein
VTPATPATPYLTFPHIWSNPVVNSPLITGVML